MGVTFWAPVFLTVWVGTKLTTCNNEAFLLSRYPESRVDKKKYKTRRELLCDSQFLWGAVNQYNLVCLCVSAPCEPANIHLLKSMSCTGYFVIKDDGIQTDKTGES